MGKMDWGRMLNIIGNVENKTLLSEVNVFKEKLDKRELNELLIVEKQHVAGFKYDSVIDEIIDEIEDYIFFSNYNVRTKTGKYGWKFTIPLNITRKIDFVETLTIEVTIIDCGDSEPTNTNKASGDGVTLSRNDHELVGGKLDSITIQLRGIVIDDELIDYSLRNSLYHELNHAYETYRRQISYFKTGKHENLMVVSGGKALEVQKNLTGDKYGQAMEDIFYRLWDKSELSAAATSTYAYLKSVGGRRENLAKDLQNSQAFREYDLLKEHIKMLNEYHEMWFWDVYKKLYSNWEHKPSQHFKDWFIKRSNVFLSRYYHYMLSSAALYYDEIEDLYSNKQKLSKMPELKKK